MTSGKRPAEPAQAAYLAHSSTLDAPSTDNAPRSRKPKSKKKREARYEEEIQYNLSYNFRGAGSRRQAHSSRMRDDTDFPPPPTYETATAVSTLVSEDFVHQGGPPHPGLASPAVTVASLPLPGPTRFHPSASDRSDTYSIDTASISLRPSREEDGSSIELVDLEPSERWELDRRHGIPLDERVKRYKIRTETTVAAPPVPYRPRLASQPTVSRSPGSQARFLTSQLSLRIPESRDRYEEDRNQDDNSDVSTPPTPKNHRMPSIPGTPSRFFHGRSQSPQPSSSVISLLRNPSPFFKSTPSLLNLSPSHHGTPHRTRTKLFHRKSKERPSSEPLEDWEVLERTGSDESSIDGSLSLLPPSPVTPQNTAPQSTVQDVFVATPSKSSKLLGDRSRKVNTVKLPQVDGAEVHRPASPPFVARHVRRHTTSSRGSQMSASSAPVSPISASSTFSASTVSLAQTAVEDTPPLPSREVATEPPRSVSRGYGARTPRMSSPAPSVSAYRDDPIPPLPSREVATEPPRSVSKGHEARTPRISSPAPPAPAYEHDPIPPLPSREVSTEPPRAVSRGYEARTSRVSSPAPPVPAYEHDPIPPLPGREVAMENPRALSKGYETKSPRISSPAPPVPAYEHDPDLPIVSNSVCSLPARSATERIVRPPDAENHALVRGRSFSRDMGMRSAPAYSSIFPSGPPMPLPNMTQSLPPTTQPSPRRHYPGRPLPATPPVSPSLTWILDKGVTHVTPHPKAMVSVTPSTPPIPEGLLIDLDDDSLDTASQSSPRPATPPCMDILGLEDDNDNDDDSASTGTVSPPGPLTPTTSGYASASASSLTLSTVASRSVEFFDTPTQTPTQTTPTDVRDVNGLVSSLGEQGLSDDDALSLIADLLGPATPPPLARAMPSLLDDEDEDESKVEAEADEVEGEIEGDVNTGGTNPTYLVGEVELMRRRVAWDGRVKLKMSLLGMAVEKCAICMTQFKAGDAGILGGTCKHAFHEKCLETWLDRSQTCPLCRERLDAR